MLSGKIVSYLNFFNFYNFANFFNFLNINLLPVVGQLDVCGQLGIHFSMASYIVTGMDEPSLSGSYQTGKEAEEEITTSKKASILLEVAGGVAVEPAEAVGGAVSADLLVGSHHLGARHIFVGAGLGYHGVFLGADKYNFLPIQVAVRMPLLEQKHAPMFGVAAGYGIALSKDYLGGAYASVDFGYRCQLNSKTAIALVAFAQFQQAKMQTQTLIEGRSFAQKAGRSLVSTGLI